MEGSSWVVPILTAIGGAVTALSLAWVRIQKVRQDARDKEAKIVLDAKEKEATIKLEADRQAQAIKADTLAQSEHFSGQLLQHVLDQRRELDALHNDHHGCEEQLSWATGRIIHFENVHSIPHVPPPPRRPRGDAEFIRQTNRQNTENLIAKAGKLKESAQSRAEAEAQP